MMCESGVADDADKRHPSRIPWLERLHLPLSTKHTMLDLCRYVVTAQLCTYR